MPTIPPTHTPARDIHSIIHSINAVNTGVLDPNYGITSGEFVITGATTSTEAADSAAGGHAPNLTQEFQAIRQQLGALAAVLENHSGQLGALRDQLDLAIAMSANIKIVAHNLRMGYTQAQLLRKTVPGHGLALAQAAAQNLDPTILKSIVAPPDAAPVGAIPVGPKVETWDYDDTDIFQMMVFYNSNFGIEPHDTPDIRFEKFGSFLYGS